MRTIKDALKESMPAQQAWIEGKTIQHQHIGSDKWEDFVSEAPNFSKPTLRWRIKPIVIPPRRADFTAETIPRNAWFRIELAQYWEYTTDLKVWRPVYQT